MLSYRAQHVFKEAVLEVKIHTESKKLSASMRGEWKNIMSCAIWDLINCKNIPRCSKSIDKKKKKKLKKHNESIEEYIMRWAKITSGGHKTSEKHKQVLTSEKPNMSNALGLVKWKCVISF